MNQNLTKSLTFRLSEKEKAAIEELSQKSGIHMALIVRQWIREALKKELDLNER